MKAVRCTTAVLMLLFVACAAAERSLSAELSDFIALVPQDKYDAIVAKHKKYDSKFNQLTEYIFTEEFQDIIAQLEASTSYLHVLTYLQDAGVDISSIGSIAGNIQGLLGVSSDGEISNSGRSLISYSSEAINAIPRKAFKQLVVQKLEESEQFAKFYAAISDKQFRSVVLKALDGNDVEDSLKTLRSNGINVRSQALLLLKIISLGPRV